MSDVFELPVKFRYDIEDYCRYTYIKNMNMHNAGIAHNALHARAVNVAVNNHDKLVDALNAITRDYIQLSESGDAGCWTPDDVEAIVDARNLLKELGHEI